MIDTLTRFLNVPIVRLLRNTLVIGLLIVLALPQPGPATVLVAVLVSLLLSLILEGLAYRAAVRARGAHLRDIAPVLRHLLGALLLALKPDSPEKLMAALMILDEDGRRWLPVAHANLQDGDALYRFEMNRDAAWMSALENGRTLAMPVPEDLKALLSVPDQQRLGGLSAVLVAPVLKSPVLRPKRGKPALLGAVVVYGQAPSDHLSVLLAEQAVSQTIVQQVARRAALLL